MLVGIAEDFTSAFQLDAELTAPPTSGLYLNQGTNQCMTVENLLAFLPYPEIEFDDWDNTATYANYRTSQKRSNIVNYDGKTYQSIADLNTGNQPDTSTDEWLETNLESLRLKTFLWSVEARVLSELKLTKRLINNQFIYSGWDSGFQQAFQQAGDFSGWGFEAKGSDYVKIRLNQVSLQKSGDTPITLYVLHNGKQIATKTVTPTGGSVDFSDFGYTFSGSGQWFFVIDSTTVSGTPSYIDPLKYDGFVAYTVAGSGNDVETATWSIGNLGNGFGWNVSVYLDSELYIDNNIDCLGDFIRATAELMALEMFLANPNNRSNREQLIQMDEGRLIYETRDLTGMTVAKRFSDEKKRVMRLISKTFDTQLASDDDFVIEVSSY